MYVFSRKDDLASNFEVHTGAILVCPVQPDIRASGNIVLRLLHHINGINGINSLLTTGTQEFL